MFTRGTTKTATWPPLPPPPLLLSALVVVLLLLTLPPVMSDEASSNVVEQRSDHRRSKARGFLTEEQSFLVRNPRSSKCRRRIQRRTNSHNTCARRTTDDRSYTAPQTRRCALRNLAGRNPLPVTVTWITKTHKGAPSWTDFKSTQDTVGAPPCTRHADSRTYFGRGVGAERRASRSRRRFVSDEQTATSLPRNQALLIGSVSGGTQTGTMWRSRSIKRRKKEGEIVEKLRRNVFAETFTKNQTTRCACSATSVRQSLKQTIS